MNCPYVNRESGDELAHSTFGVRGFSPALARELQLPAEPSHRDTMVLQAGPVPALAESFDRSTTRSEKSLSDHR